MAERAPDRDDDLIADVNDEEMTGIDDDEEEFEDDLDEDEDDVEEE
jgi:hypothetical protein